MEGITTTVLLIFVFIVLLSFLIGTVLGWLARQEVTDFLVQQQLPSHPEFYDENGNYMPDQLLYIRVENQDDTDTAEEEY